MSQGCFPNIGKGPRLEQPKYKSIRTIFFAIIDIISKLLFYLINKTR
jgi:hypothetical protein